MAGERGEGGRREEADEDSESPDEIEPYIEGLREKYHDHPDDLGEHQGPGYGTGEADTDSGKGVGRRN